MDDRIFHKEAISLRDAGHEVVIICGGPRDAERTVDGIRLIEVSPGTGLPRGPFRRRKMVGRARYLEPDLVHAHEPDSLGIACRVKDSLGARVIYDAHENYPVLAGIGGESWPRRKLHEFRLTGYEKKFCPRADYIFAATDPLTDLFEGYGPPVSALYNYPRTELFHPAEDAEMKTRYLGKKVFVYAGSLRRSRGPSRMVDSIIGLSCSHPSVLLSVMSPHPIEPLIGEIGRDLRKHFDFHGFVEHTQVPRYLTVGLAGLLLLDRTPAYQVAAPIKMFEYMACGLPVIASRLQELSKFIEPHGAGILVGEGVGELLEAMKRCIESPGEATEMGLRGLRAVRERYNWSESEKVLLQAYSKLV
jgi:glycosyltransferase involved in cell wall biosynthesis